MTGKLPNVFPVIFRGACPTFDESTTAAARQMSALRIIIPGVPDLVSIFYSTPVNNINIRHLILKRMAGLMVKFAGGSMSDGELFSLLLEVYP
jgi:hypothetical protein